MIKITAVGKIVLLLYDTRIFVSGETCDMHFNRKDDFLIADEIMRPGNTWGRAWRDMCDPPSISKHLICFYNRQYICNSHSASKRSCMLHER